MLLDWVADLSGVFLEAQVEAGASAVGASHSTRTPHLPSPRLQSRVPAQITRRYQIVLLEQKWVALVLVILIVLADLLFIALVIIKQHMYI